MLDKHEDISPADCSMHQLSAALQAADQNENETAAKVNFATMSQTLSSIHGTATWVQASQQIFCGTATELLLAVIM